MNHRIALALALGLACGCAGGPSAQQMERALTHRQLAQLKLAKGEVPYAVREYRAALEAHERDAESHFGLGEAYRQLGSFAESEQHLRRALQIDAEHQDSRLNLSALYLQQQRWDDALREAEVLLADPTFLNPARAYVNRGWARYQLGQLAQAEADLREALRRDGSGIQAHLNLGIVLFDRGQLVEAMASLQRVVDLLERYQNPAFDCAEAEARFRLAKAYVKLGNHDKALGELEQAGAVHESCRWRGEAQEYLAVLR